MTLDYTKMFLIVTEGAVVKGHFAFKNTGFLTALRGVIFFVDFPKSRCIFNRFIIDCIQVFLLFHSR